ncbi:MAG: UvrD-helicase domain-containing protein [Desulfohalobiaceae bacterium]|nr:UvrD-helicase domain-containing protein [Desulfohalobiaceae bacterium]
MELFYSDLHIHSRFSRATSKSLTLRNLAAWGALKGLHVLGTGDFTHPGWLQEIEENLIQEESGLLRLRETEGLDREIPWMRGETIAGKTRFMLCTEISSIYKSRGAVRKIHNLVFMPNLEKAKHFSQRLAQVGNIESDGRPILGLDARDLLEMVLECDPLAFLVPAHIWTPWFSLFGSKSGFDRIEDCFGDLSKHIFALETGLSSDPEMNWLWSRLDRYTLISNSDAHSGEKLAREANIFSGEPAYEAILRAMKHQGLGSKFLGTIEFFPEEGKYHLDGQRKCGVVLDPKEAIQPGRLCPQCNKPLTQGVLNRIVALADRTQPLKPQQSPDFISLIPLQEVLSEILGVGPKTKTVTNTYKQLLLRFGSELRVLQNIPLDDLKSFHPLLAEGIARMRRKDVYKEPGFDGQFGRISVFSPREREKFSRGRKPAAGRKKKTPQTTRQEELPAAVSLPFSDQIAPDPSLNTEQQTAVKAGRDPLLVLAGPGTGKTRTLLGRVERLISQGCNPRQILILTFTRAAAKEVKERLAELFGPEQGLPLVDTLHALAFETWQQTYNQSPTLLTEEEGLQIFAQANSQLPAKEARQAKEQLNLAREKRHIPDELAAAARNFSEQKDSWNLVDYSDLLESWLELIESGAYSNPFNHVLVDEVQDLSPLQIELVTRLLSENGTGFFAIGDPRQSIYSFRGAVGDCTETFRETWPGLQVVGLKENYRSKQNLLDFAGSLFPESRNLLARIPGKGDLVLYQAQNFRQEALWIGRQIKGLLGSTSHSESDRGLEGGLTPGDIGILVRFKALIPPLEQSLKRLGLPCTVPEAVPFWEDPRIKHILQAAAEFLGISFSGRDDTDSLNCPDHILAEGPNGVAAYFEDVSPFDRIFWKSQSFQDLKKAYQEQGGWANLISWIRLESDLYLVRQKAQKIRLLTLHASKGLEFEAVFIPALEQGILPFAGKGFLAGRPGTDADRPTESEEKRLFYVGLTRARSRLFLSRADHRKIYNRNYHLQASPFLDLLPLAEVRRVKSVAHSIKKEKQLPLFRSDS